MKKKTLKIIPLGGSGEIGKNMNALEYDGKIIVIDAGIKFPEEEHRGIDLLVPDVTYLQERLDNLLGIFLTHGHEDHIGAMPYILPLLAKNRPLPIYGSPLTVGFVQVRLEDHRLLKNAQLNAIEPHKRYQVGPFGIEFLRVAHSIPDSMAIAIHTPVGTVIFTGDFKMDPEAPTNRQTDVERLRELGDEGVLVLLSDATRVEQEGWTPSESVVTQELGAIIEEAPGRVLIASFASNIARLGYALEAAERSGRKAAVLGRGLEQNSRVARELGYLPQGIPLHPLESVLRLPPRQQLLFTTGAQGEPLAALTRIANGVHPKVRVGPTDTVVISATPVPGNEETVAQTIDFLFKHGAKVIYPALNSSVHVSGHASREQLREMLRLTRPKYVIPTHGEYRHLALYRELALEEGMPDERIFLAVLGRAIEIDRDGARYGENVPTGVLLIDRLQVGGQEKTIIRRESTLTDQGVLIAAIVIDRAKSALIGEPLLAARGFDADGHLEEVARVLKRELSRNGYCPAYGELVERTKSAVARVIYSRTKLRPLILPIVTEF